MEIHKPSTSKTILNFSSRPTSRPPDIPREYVKIPLRNSYKSEIYLNQSSKKIRPKSVNFMSESSEHPKETSYYLDFFSKQNLFFKQNNSSNIAQKCNVILRKNHQQNHRPKSLLYLENFDNPETVKESNKSRPKSIHNQIFPEEIIQKKQKKIFNELNLWTSKTLDEIQRYIDDSSPSSNQLEDEETTQQLNYWHEFLKAENLKKTQKQSSQNTSDYSSDFSSQTSKNSLLKSKNNLENYCNLPLNSNNSKVESVPFTTNISKDKLKKLCSILDPAPNLISSKASLNGLMGFEKELQFNTLMKDPINPVFVTDSPIKILKKSPEVISNYGLKLKTSDFNEYETAQIHKVKLREPRQNQQAISKNIFSNMTQKSHVNEEYEKNFRSIDSESKEQKSFQTKSKVELESSKKLAALRQPKRRPFSMLLPAKTSVKNSIISSDYQTNCLSNNCVASYFQNLNFSSNRRSSCLIESGRELLNNKNNNIQEFAPIYKHPSKITLSTLKLSSAIDFLLRRKKTSENSTNNALTVRNEESPFASHPIPSKRSIFCTSNEASSSTTTQNTHVFQRSTNASSQAKRQQMVVLRQRMQNCLMSENSSNYINNIV